MTAGSRDPPFLDQLYFMMSYTPGLVQSWTPERRELPALVSWAAGNMRAGTPSSPSSLFSVAVWLSQPQQQRVPQPGVQKGSAEQPQRAVVNFDYQPNWIQKRLEAGERLCS